MTLYELFVKITGDSSGFKKSMSEASQATDSFGAKAAQVGSRLAGALGLAALGAGAVAAARKFDEAGVQIQRSTGATGAKLDALKDSFTNVYKQSAQSAEAITGALTIIQTRTNLTGTALEDLTLKMLKLAKTQREDVGSIMPAVTRMFGDWSIATDRQGKSLDYLRTISQQTGSRVADLASTVVYAGAPLRMLGYDFEQATALIGKFEKEGVNTELVLGGMKAALQKFAKEGVTDTAGEWQKFVDGVRSGAITLQGVLEMVGAKRGPDLYRAIMEGRFEIDKMVDSSKKLASDGGASMETFATKVTKVYHAIEALAANHVQLIQVSSGVATALGTIGTTAFLAGIKLGPLGLAGIFVGLGAAMDAFINHPALRVAAKLFAGPAGVAMDVIEGARKLAGGDKKGMAFPVGAGAISPAPAQTAAGAVTGASAGEVSVLQDIGKALEAIPWQKATTEGAALNEILEKQQRKFQDSATAIAEYRWAFEMGNLEMPPAIANYEALSEATEWAIDPTRKLTEAQFDLNSAWADAIVKFSRVDPKVQAAGIKDLEISLKAAEKATKGVSEKASELQREFRKAFDHMARGIADSIVEWKGFGDTALSVVKDLAKGILEILVNQALKKLASSLMDVLGLTSKVFGGAASAAGAGASAAASAGGAVASGAGGIASSGGGAASAVGGLAGTVTAVSGVVSAVSGVISNFQMAGMNKSLDLIEHETRYTHLILQAMMDLQNLHLPKLESIWGYFWTVQTEYLNKITAALEPGGSASGKGGATTVNVYLDSKKIWSGLATQAQLQGA